ncbi:MAG: ethanolamine ammonia-lyase reactivating factor EutA, partial [Clostridia bacterium]|nr:ethanolamine ammonia-lyase reactivating factor EutA [Clostridia bacterium]
MPSEILSVGIDIGTSTTQVIFSRLLVDNMADYFSAPRISIVSKELLYKSEVHLTPLRDSSTLDGEGVRRIVEQEYRRAGISPGDLHTGAVIITGESARKDNAAAVTEQLSGFAGEFVVSTAGPDLESIIAAKGSGAFQYSIDRECSVINLDIGGGTTNIAVFDCGRAVAKGCLDIGGRLIR